MNLKSQFYLDPEITFLNFGSYGACPKPVFKEYQRLQLELESEPVQFIAVNGLRYLKDSRDALGKYINCAGDDLVYVTNPSYAVNIIAKNFNLNPGDEILTTDLEYGACDKAWNYYCKKKNAKYIRQKLTLPLTTKEKFIEEFFRGLSPKTKAIFISSITSATSLILPVKEICAIAKQKGLITIIDGAHVPGHINLNIRGLDADIFTGACHKWMMTPKGSSFLYVRRELQHLFDPLLISWGYESDYPSSSQFIDYHQMQGTRDYSSFLTIPTAIKFMEEHDWKNVSTQCRKLVKDNAQRFCDLLKTQPLCPLTDEFIGQMFSIPIRTNSPEKLQRHLFENYRIEIPVMKYGNEFFLRYSVNGFNSQQDLDKLFDAVNEIIHDKQLIEVN